MGVNPPEVSVKDVPLDEDLAELFGEAKNAEFQSLLLLVQLNRRLARLEGKETPLEETANDT